MSLLSDNVIPGNHGKIFETDANDHNDLEKIKKRLLSIDGIRDVLFDTTQFVKEFTVHTSEIVEVKAIQDEVSKLGFHAIPKGLFPL